MDLRECYMFIGADYDEVMRRFAREGRVDHFLKLFLWDQSFAKLCRAMDTGCKDDAVQQAHTMKGISMCLGLTELTRATIDLAENLRSRQSDDETLQSFEEVKEVYLRITEAVRGHLS